MPESIRVLVLEDDDSLRTMLVNLLGEEGYEVCSASNGLEALQHSRARPFDVIVADVRMEGMSGLDVLETVHQEAPETRSLVITGYASEEDSLRAIRAGVGDYLKKPFRMADFLASVAGRVQERRRELEQQEKDATMRQTALGALRALVSTQPGGLGRAGELASRLARVLGGSAETCECLEIAALIEALRAQGMGALVEWAATNSRWSTLAAEAAQPFPGVGREARILAVALAAAARERDWDEEPASLAVDLSRTHPGRFDPTVLEALDRPPGAPQAEHRRGLLTLARALEGAGDRAGAQAAYQELTVAPVASQEVVSAWLALGRLTRTPEAWQKALEAARSLGPGSTGLAALEAGLEQGDASLLEEAARLLGEVGNPVAQAQALLALARGNLEAPLAVLLQHPRELASCATWLVPLLRSAPAGPAVTAALARLGADAPTAPAPGLRVHSLGSFEVFRGSERVAEADWITKKAKYLFAYLCAHGRFVHEDVLIEEFYPGDAEKGKKALYTTTSRLRKSLQQEVDPILRRDGHLQVNPELTVWHDFEELEECLKPGEGALERARRVAQLYRGPFLDGCYMDWALTLRDRLEREVSALLFRLAQHCWSKKRLDEAQEYVQRALDVDPCHQEGHLLAMHVFMASNRPEEAVRQFERAERLLRQRMDMLPSIELMEAHQRARLSIP